MDENQGRTIADRICAARLEIDRIAKRGKNTFHNYQYATAEDIQADVGEALAKHGLYLSKKTTKCDWSVAKTSRGGEEQRCLIAVTYRIHASPQEFVEHEDCYGEGRDSGDKAYYKAATGSFKYFLIQAFCLGIGDDPEASGDAEREAAPPERERVRAVPEDVRQQAADKASDQQMRALAKAAKSKLGDVYGVEWLRRETKARGITKESMTVAQCQELMQILAEFNEDPLPDELPAEETH